MANVKNWDVLASKTGGSIAGQSAVVVKLGRGLYASAYTTKGDRPGESNLTLRIISDPNRQTKMSILPSRDRKTLKTGRRWHQIRELPFPDRRANGHIAVGVKALKWNRDFMESMSG